MKNFVSALLLLMMITFVVVSCKKDPTDTTPTDPSTTFGSLKLKFKNMAGDSLLVLNSAQYTNAANDTFMVSKFDYYISNIKLIKTDQSSFSETESYHLLKASAGSSLEFTIENVPAGTYSGIEFMIGVDSARNVSGAQTGALDPANGMFWSWNTGYIMAKFEGTTTNNVSVQFHIGGFTGSNNVLKKVNPSFGNQTVTVASSTTPAIIVEADVLEWFTTPTTINLDSLHDVTMPNNNAKMIADNYADMFTIVSISN